MKLSAYHVQTPSTAVFPGAGEGNFLYPVLGFIGEVGEYMSETERDEPDVDKIYDEFGDIMWYTSLICHEAHIDFPALITTASYYMMAGSSTMGHKVGMYALTNLAESMKKLWRGRTEDTYQMALMNLRYLLCVLFSDFKRYYQHDQICLFQTLILEANAHKLKMRKAKNELKERRDVG